MELPFASLSLLLVGAALVFASELGDETRDDNAMKRGEKLAEETSSEFVGSKKLRTTEDKMCRNDKVTCSSCRSLGVCKDGVLTEVPCRGLYPYCDPLTASCTAVRKKCKEESADVVCPASGYYPDPKSCRGFHVCEGDLSYKFTCNPLEVYDHVTKKCGRPGLRVRCAPFSCLGKQGRYAVYPTDPSLYALCADATATALFVCPAGRMFDETAQKCVPMCTSQKDEADPDDPECQRYYKCVKSGDGFKPTVASCPSRQVFDPARSECVPSTPTFRCPSKPLQELNFGETEESFFRESPMLKVGESQTTLSPVHEIKSTQSEISSTTGKAPTKPESHPTSNIPGVTHGRPATTMPPVTKPLHAVDEAPHQLHENPARLTTTLTTSTKSTSS